MNSLSVIYFSRPVNRRMVNGEVDLRYRCSITLVASQRPRYWSFHCPMCSKKVCEVSGTLISISDVADSTSIDDFQPAPLVVRCGNKYCKLWFEFLTLSGTD